MQHGGPHNGGLLRCHCIIGPLISLSITKQYRINAVAFSWTSVRKQYYPSGAGLSVLKSTTLELQTNSLAYFHKKGHNVSVSYVKIEVAFISLHNCN